MNYIVLDMEWNQPLSPGQTVRTPVILHGEIIRIGAVKLNNFERFSCSVKPRFYKKLHSGVARLTGLKNADLKDGLSFAEAFEQFRVWCGTNFSFLTWGADDIFMLQDNLKVNGLDPDWIPPSYNIQNLFDQQITKENRIYTLTASLEKVGEGPIRAHDALDDAYGAALLCKHLDLKALKNYSPIRRKTPKKQKAEEPLASTVFKTGYPTRGKLLRAQEVSRFVCPSCHAEMTGSRWTSCGKGGYIAQGHCECGREYFFRLRIRQNTDGLFLAGRSVYAMTTERKKAFRLYQKKNYQKQKIQK